MKSWKNVVSKLIMVIFAGVLFFSVQTNTYAATKLTAPEAGWKRYDDTNGAFVYLGENWIYQTGSASLFNSTQHYSSQGMGGNEVRFKFYGTKMRLISSTGPAFANDISVIIDGVSEKFSAKLATTTVERQQLIYEKTNLSLGIHEVKLISGTNGDWRLDIDAVDIDETGYLMASVGSQLKTPEDGWKRYDDTQSEIKYLGEWLYASASTNDSNNSYNKTLSWSNSPEATISFKFKGTKLRVIAIKSRIDGDAIPITIDGVNQTYNLYIDSTTKSYMPLVFEKTGLEDGIHTVTIGVQNGHYSNLDAIDIDDTGYLINTDLSAPIDLSAEAVKAKIDLNWTSVTKATSYNIKRSTTEGGPYETIASNVTNTTYTDINVATGVKYYYVVSAVNGAGEGEDSNEVSAMPLVDNGRAILTIYLTNGTEKEYDLSMTEVNAFIDWYDQKDAGVGPAKYAFTKAWNKGPFLKRTEYVVFDKILTFSVDEYEADEE
ncbi:fibronectin type III domain-containing protein [Paenibacillus typhae]|uniref:fibronectin type III domain-containing protein n=1 Tax=Paenibacillus typhae TaxID=1174501 RepID=UPI001C8DC372|nr:fibronectin type III domain-containing protein [Paenibacillus typhae]MBY0012653.1 hypothetical protein [Paenibacillus typhae]